jgi:DNA-binding HxlR family transcriptional regulator
MNSSGQAAEAIAVEREQQPAELSSPASLLTFIGSGTVGPIIAALGPRALRTNALTQRLPAYSPRTIYRHSRRLSELGLIEREETGGVPSSVLQRLSESGRDLYRLLDSYAKGDDGPEAGAMNGAAWTTCASIGEMWELGWIQALGQRGRSASELTAAASKLSRHQVANRTRQLQAWDLLHKSSVRGQEKRYQLSDRGRRGAALILALARWREQHVAGVADAGLSPPEAAAALRACLPLLKLPAHLEARLSFGVAGLGDEGSGDTATVSAHLHGGRVRCVKDPTDPDSWAAGTVKSWLGAIADGKHSSLRTGGDRALVDALLAQLHDIL